MAKLLLGLVLFFGPHSLSIVARGWRERIVLRIGRGTWMALYSLIALIGLLLIIQGYSATRAAPIVLYTPPAWLRSITLLLMVPVFPLLLAAYLPGRIQSTLKHPLLAGTKAWATAHLLANGMLGDVLLFGSFLLWAVIDRISFKRRGPQQIARLPPSRANDAIAVIGGLVLYVLFAAYLHQRLIGVAVLPAGSR